MKNEILKMKIGEQKDIVFRNGILKSTKTLIRNTEKEFEVNCFVDGWATAYLTLDEAIKYCKGELNHFDLKWE